MRASTIIINVNIMLNIFGTIFIHLFTYKRINDIIILYAACATDDRIVDHVHAHIAPPHPVRGRCTKFT